MHVTWGYFPLFQLRDIPYVDIKKTVQMLKAISIQRVVFHSDTGFGIMRRKSFHKINSPANSLLDQKSLCLFKDIGSEEALHGSTGLHVLWVHWSILLSPLSGNKSKELDPCILFANIVRWEFTAWNELQLNFFSSEMWTQQFKYIFSTLTIYILHKSSLSIL